MKITLFSGIVYRALSLSYYKTAFSAKGARLHSGRFNRRDVAGLYLALDPATAIAEYHRGSDPTPVVLVAAKIEVKRLVDLTGSLSGWNAPWTNWECDWEKARDDLLAGFAGADCDSWKASDEAIAKNCGGIMYPSRQNPGGNAVVLFVEDAITGSLKLEPIDPKMEILAAHPLN